MFRDLKLTLRQLLKSPGFSASAVLMLALGIGATTAIFSIVEGVLLRPLPFPSPDRVVALSDLILGMDLATVDTAGVTAPGTRTYARETHAFEYLGAYLQMSYELSGREEVKGSPLRVT